MDLQKIKSGKTIKELLEFSIINLDKPSGPTSFQVSQYVKNLLEINKTSHFGTLDPMVSGVLPVALGRACRLNEWFMHRDKEYTGIMRLHDEVPDELLKEKIKQFIGKITQVPPVKSRVKRAERLREVKTFEIIEKNRKDILFKTKVQAGTYIRKLIHDIGKEIGGAHMLELRRIKAGMFDENKSVNLYEFDRAVEEYRKGNEELLIKILIPADKAIQEVLPRTNVVKISVSGLLRGKPLMMKDLDKKNLPSEDSFIIFSEEKFIGVYKKSDEGIIIARPEFVFN